MNCSSNEDCSKVNVVMFDDKIALNEVRMLLLLLIFMLFDAIWFCFRIVVEMERDSAQRRIVCLRILRTSRVIRFRFRFRILIYIISHCCWLTMENIEVLTALIANATVLLVYLLSLLFIYFWTKNNIVFLKINECHCNASSVCEGFDGSSMLGKLHCF